MILTLCALGFALLADSPEIQPGGAAVPADFKLSITLFGVAPEPLQKTDLVVHKGRGYLFNPGPPLEVVIHDPAAGRLELLNLVAKVRSEVTFKRLDDFQAKLHSAIAAAAAKREAQGGRANQIAAEMSRDLIDPRFTVAVDDAGRSRRIRLSNSTVEVAAAGEPETDPARLAAIHAILTALAQLESARAPDDLPPFPRLDALRALTIERSLRPTELVFIYRMTRAPFKLRWTYRLEPTLTPRELEAIARVEAVRNESRFLRFDRYRFNETKRPGSRRPPQPQPK